MPSLVRAASLTNFDAVARETGLDPRRLLLDAGIPPSVLGEPDLRIPADRVAGLLESAARAAGVEAFGLRMAETRQLSNLGPVGLVVRDQPTLRDSLAVLVRYHAALNGSLAMALEEAGDRVIVREEVLAGAGVPVRQATELAIGVLLRVMRRLLGEAWAPRLVAFVHAAPRDLSVHRRMFGASLAFGEEFNGIVCTRAELDVRNPSADPLMARYAERLLQASLAPPDASVVDDVRRTALLLLPSRRCSIEQVADHLGLVPRTVQRRLAEAGLSFTDVVDELRAELAQRHVTQSDRPLTEVSDLLGFAAPSGFSRWYQQRFGCSPSQARAAARA